MTALNAKVVELFTTELQKYAAVLIGCVPISVIYRYQREKLSLEWREWMTNRVMSLYMNNRVYYKIERTMSTESTNIDNPDQRITEDIRSFTAFSLTIFITIMKSIFDLISYSAILYVDERANTHRGKHTSFRIVRAVIGRHRDALFIFRSEACRYRSYN